MTQEEKQRLVEAVKTIHDYCQSRPCKGCIFESSALHEKCALTYNDAQPYEWDWFYENEV